MTMKSRSRNLWTMPPGFLVPTEVELFHDAAAAEGQEPTVSPEERFKDFEREAQDQKARALGIPTLPRGEAE
jgi:hypothetical protein